MFEHRKQPLVSRSIFIRRFARSIAVALIMVSVSLAIGMIGYNLFEDLPWIDAYLESAMILSGMGPTATMKTAWGKIFSGTYAIYSGLMIILIMGVLIAPIAHRIFHKFHIATDDKN